jgi:hypothetical protein
VENDTGLKRAAEVHIGVEDDVDANGGRRLVECLTDDVGQRADESALVVDLADAQRA